MKWWSIFLKGHVLTLQCWPIFWWSHTAVWRSFEIRKLWYVLIGSFSGGFCFQKGMNHWVFCVDLCWKKKAKLLYCKYIPQVGKLLFPAVILAGNTNKVTPWFVSYAKINNRFTSKSHILDIRKIIWTNEANFHFWVPCQFSGVLNSSAPSFGGIQESIRWVPAFRSSKGWSRGSTDL